MTFSALLLPKKEKHQPIRKLNLSK